jgi:hypothetical protein
MRPDAIPDAANIPGNSIEGDHGLRYFVRHGPPSRFVPSYQDSFPTATTSGIVKKARKTPIVVEIKDKNTLGPFYIASQA